MNCGPVRYCRSIGEAQRRIAKDPAFLRADNQFLDCVPRFSRPASNPSHPHPASITISVTPSCELQETPCVGTIPIGLYQLQPRRF
jgi:hypothetical protein